MQTRKLIQLFFAVFFVLISIKSVFAEDTGIQENIYKRFTALQCDSLIQANETNPDFVILDVRTPNEWNGYHIMGSINRSTGLPDFTAQLGALPKHKIFVLHCQSGGRSAGAFQKMKDLQFAEVYEMIGGINSWNSSGLPTTTTTQPKLMLVDYKTITGNENDTLKITVTNRANGELAFTSAKIEDLHPVSDDFDLANQIQGAWDYTFSIIHSSHYSGDDSTQVVLESNGGDLDLNIVFKNGIIQGIHEQKYNELVIYPNPAREKIYIKNGFDLEEISVLNINGQVIYRNAIFDSENGIEVSSLKNGIYFLRLVNNGKMEVKKFIVQH